MWVQFLNKDFEWNLIFVFESAGPSGSGRVVRTSPERFILHALSYASDPELSTHKTAFLKPHFRDKIYGENRIGNGTYTNYVSGYVT